MISCLVLSACSNYVEGKAAIKTWSTTSPTPKRWAISMVKMPSWKYISPFPKTRFLERQPYRGAGLTKAPLELGLWKGTVRETELSEQALTPQRPNNQPGVEGGPAKGTQSYFLEAQWCSRWSTPQTAAQGRQQQARCPPQLETQPVWGPHCFYSGHSTVSIAWQHRDALLTGQWMGGEWREGKRNRRHPQP